MVGWGGGVGMNYTVWFSVVQLIYNRIHLHTHSHAHAKDQ